MKDQIEVADIITRDCAYGFSGHAVLSNGERTAFTNMLHPTREEAEKAVSDQLRAAGFGAS